MAATATIVYVKAVIGFCGFCVRRGYLAPRISRKMIHIAAGSWVIFWPLFDQDHWTWKLNVVVPFMYSIQLLVKGIFLKDSSDVDVQTMSRTGSPRELLNGPLCFTLAMTLVGLRLFRTQLGVVVMACLGFGDGMAPLVGHYFPFWQYPTFPFSGDTKTMSGSVGCFVASIAGYYALRFVANDLAGAEQQHRELAMITRVASIVAITEGISGRYDNPSIALAAILAFKWCLASSNE